MTQATYLEVNPAGTLEEMEPDPIDFCIGEDSGVYRGALQKRAF